MKTTKAFYYKLQSSWPGAHTFNPSLSRQRQGDLCELKASQPCSQMKPCPQNKIYKQPKDQTQTKQK